MVAECVSVDQSLSQRYLPLLLGWNAHDDQPPHPQRRPQMKLTDHENETKAPPSVLIHYSEHSQSSLELNSFQFRSLKGEQRPGRSVVQEHRAFGWPFRANLASEGT
ncbi:hypothetical protein N7524_003699 [Penicillium chrysogenum]|nr:hypothetical protein N7524_003699 [Penicillium chrysogenum]